MDKEKLQNDLPWDLLKEASSLIIFCLINNIDDKEKYPEVYKKLQDYRESLQVIIDKGEKEDNEMAEEYLPKPVGPLIDNRKPEDKALIDGIVAGLKIANVKGDDISFCVDQALKEMGRYDLLPPCEKKEKNI